MKLYVGLDVGLEETILCIVDSEGVTVREVKVSTGPEAIRCALEGSADRLDRMGAEASSLGIWLYRELQPAGVPIIVAEARLCVFRFRRCATKLIGMMHAASHR
jgi:transposase